LEQRGKRLQFEHFQTPRLGVHVLSTTKFKTNTLVLNIQRPLRVGEVTTSALLPYVLTRGSRQYPSVQAMQRALDDMYGSVGSSDTFKVGERHVMQFRWTLPNGRYLPGRPELLREGIAYLYQMLGDPLMEDGAFRASFVTLEKEALRKRVEGIFNHKAQYARLRCIEAMCPEEPYRLYSGGRIEDLAAITPETLRDAYARICATAPMDLYVVGDVDPTSVAAELERVFVFEGRESVPLDSAPISGKVLTGVQEVRETAAVNQGQLVMGYRVPVRYGDGAFYAMMMFNGVLGGFAHSKLFVNVREKASLAYSVRSHYDPHKGLLLVQAGINVNEQARARALIEAQFAAIASGDVTDMELEQTKAMLINTYREAYDSPGALINLAYESCIAGHERSIEELTKAIPDVTRDDLRVMAEMLRLDTVYFLSDEPSSVVASGSASAVQD
jgi:predicted Zn-dependent peptidase